jgi:hypothetical protein
MSMSKRYAVAQHDETAVLSSKSFKHGHRNYIPPGKQAAKRMRRRMADRRETVLVMREWRKHRDI